jgi:hypothetical protein
MTDDEIAFAIMGGIVASMIAFAGGYYLSYVYHVLEGD